MADDWKKKWSDSGYYFSPEDMKRAEYDEGFRDRTFENKAGWYAAQAAGDQAGMDRYHQAQETNRGTAYGGGYSGGVAGDEYNPFGNALRTDSGANMVQSVMNKMSEYDKYLDPLYSNLQGKVDAISNREPFSYDYKTDPAWQAYKKEYTREGRRASEDTMGQYAVMTGGMPSTAAMTAASQANDYYNAKMTDKIPELYKLAYDMYADEANRQMNELNALRGYSNDLYGRWGDEFSRLGTMYNIGANERGYETEEGNKIYAFGDGEPYEIGSGKGQYFVLNSIDGDSMVGGDGSVWRNEGGRIIITKDGQTWTIGGGAQAAPTYYWTGGQGDGDGNKTQTGMSSAEFDSSLDRIEKNLKRGKQAEASYIIEGMWNGLSSDQQNEISGLLDKYGY